MGSSQASPQRSSLEANATSYSNGRRGGGRQSLTIDNIRSLIDHLLPSENHRDIEPELIEAVRGDARGNGLFSPGTGARGDVTLHGGVE